MGLETAVKVELKTHFPMAFVQGNQIPSLPGAANTTHIIGMLDANSMVHNYRTGTSALDFLGNKRYLAQRRFTSERTSERVPIDLLIVCDNSRLVTPVKLAEQADRSRKAATRNGEPVRLRYPDRPPVPKNLNDELEPEWRLLVSDRAKRAVIMKWMVDDILAHVEIPPHCSIVVVDGSGVATSYDMHWQSGRAQPVVLGHFQSLFGEGEFAALAFASRLRRMQRALRVEQANVSGEIDAMAGCYETMSDGPSPGVKFSESYNETFDPLEGAPPPDVLRLEIDSNDGDLILMCAAATEACRSQNIEVVIRSEPVKQRLDVPEHVVRELPDDVRSKITKQANGKLVYVSQAVDEHILPHVLWDCAMRTFGGRRERVWSLFMLAFFEGCDLCPRPMYDIGAGKLIDAFINDFDDTLLTPPATWLNRMPWSEHSLNSYIPHLRQDAFERLACVALYNSTPTSRRANTHAAAMREGYVLTLRAFCATASATAAAKKAANGTQPEKPSRADKVTPLSKLRKYFQHAHYALLYYCLYGWTGFPAPSPEAYGWTKDTSNGVYVTSRG